jgi:hypothetical protein
MYRDRSVSLNRIIRDIKAHIHNGIATDAADETVLYLARPPIHITDILLHAACCEPWYDGKYIVRVDEFAVNYTDENNIECTCRRHFRYDCFCDDPDMHNTITIVNDVHSAEPFIRTTVGQKSITQHIERHPSTDAVKPFWIRVKAEQDSFTPKDRDTPVMYHKLSVAENFV